MICDGGHAPSRMTSHTWRLLQSPHTATNHRYTSGWPNMKNKHFLSVLKMFIVNNDLIVKQAPMSIKVVLSSQWNAKRILSVAKILMCYIKSAPPIYSSDIIVVVMCWKYQYPHSLTSVCLDWLRHFGLLTHCSWLHSLLVYPDSDR